MERAFIDGDVLGKMMAVAGRLHAEFAKAECTVKVSSDLAELEDVVVKGKGHVTPHFSKAANTFQKSEAFWVGVWKDGKCIGTVGCKRQRLGTESLASFSKRYWEQVYTTAEDPNVEMDAIQKQSFSEITGNLIYAGEFWVDQEFRKLGIGALLAGYMKIASWLMWPDSEFLYIFMEDRDARAGLMSSLEFNSQVPRAIKWVTSPNIASDNYWLAGIDLGNFLEWLDEQEGL